jgi:MauM/NapG family ferredoxin protein
MGKKSRRLFFEAGAVAGASALVGGVLAGNKSGAIARSEKLQTAVVRPPGALPEDEFIASCIGCKQCAEVCSNGCIQFSRWDHAPGTPYLKTREQPCILCMKCTQVCPTGALKSVPSDSVEDIQANVKMGVAVVDENICNSYNGYVCGACVFACPFAGKALKAITWEQPVVDPDYCVGCGLCEKACIVYPQAIRVVPKSVS